VATSSWRVAPQASQRPAWGSGGWGRGVLPAHQPLPFSWPEPAAARLLPRRPGHGLCVDQGEVDQACQLGIQALQLLGAVEYETGVQRVRDLRTKLRPWPDHPAVADLTEQLLLVS
jgi:hypothetical protein